MSDDLRIAQIDRLHQPHFVTKSVPVFDEFDSPWQTSERCKECDHLWPCKTVIILRAPVVPPTEPTPPEPVTPTEPTALATCHSRYFSLDGRQMICRRPRGHKNLHGAWVTKDEYCSWNDFGSVSAPTEPDEPTKEQPE